MSIPFDPRLAEIERREDRRQHRLMWAVLIMAVITVGGVVMLNVGRISDNATLRAQQSTQARSDCARKINDVRTELRDVRDNAQSDLIVAILTQPIDTVLVRNLQMEAQSATAKLKALPKLSVEVEKKCPSV